MTNYEKAVAIWQRRDITNDAELAEALNGHSVAFAYHSGKIENERITYHDTREILVRNQKRKRSERAFLGFVQ